jgi:hypothetical protein
MLKKLPDLSILRIRSGCLGDDLSGVRLGLCLLKNHDLFMHLLPKITNLVAKFSKYRTFEVFTVK